MTKKASQKEKVINQEKLKEVLLGNDEYKWIVEIAMQKIRDGEPIGKCVDNFLTVIGIWE